MRGKTARKVKKLTALLNEIYPNKTYKYRTLKQWVTGLSWKERTKYLRNKTNG